MRTRGEGGSEPDQKYAFVRRFIENATISDTLKLQILPVFSHKMKTKLLMKNLRHASLHIYKLNIRQDIHVQKN